MAKRRWLRDGGATSQGGGHLEEEQDGRGGLGVCVQDWLS